MTDALISSSGTDHATVEERRQQGRALRRDVPHSSLADRSAGPDRPDPVALLEEQNKARLPQLLPIRRGRTGVSAFTFYRGAARIMATDLATTASG